MSSFTVPESCLFTGLQIHFVLLFYLGMADAQVHILRTNIRIMQEELEQLSSEYYKKVPKSEMNEIHSLTLCPTEDHFYVAQPPRAMCTPSCDISNLLPP